MLYLLKSAVNNEYLQENLRILAAPAGEEITIDYVARWVDPALWGNIRPGEEACLVFSDRPYRRFVPVRRAQQVDYVIDFIRFGAHRNLEEDCKQAGVTYVRVPRSRSLDQIVRALAEAHGMGFE